MIELISTRLTNSVRGSSQVTEQDTMSATDSKAISLQSETQAAGWMTDRGITDRREKLRSRAAFPVSILPLDVSLSPTGHLQEGTLLNYSEGGACLEHSSLLAEPYLRMIWVDTTGLEHAAVVRLKWCRSIGENSYLSGGKVVGMD